MGEHGVLLCIGDPLGASPLHFPTGRFLNRRWVWAGWVAALACVTVVFGEASATEIGPDDGRGNTLWTISNPIGFLDHPGMEDAGRS